MCSRPCSRKTISFSVVAALLLAALVSSNCLATCIACFQLKGVLIRLKDGTTIKGYAAWNQAWAEIGYLSSNPQASIGEQALMTIKEFPEVIFDPMARIDEITVYTHLRAIKYPIENALVATREPTRVYVKEIQNLKMSPGPYDGYHGASGLQVESPRIADLLQTKPAASCCYDEGVADVCWVSYSLPYRTSR